MAKVIFENGFKAPPELVARDPAAVTILYADRRADKFFFSCPEAALECLATMEAALKRDGAVVEEGQIHSLVFEAAAVSLN